MRLADEVVAFLAEYCPGPRLKKISFIGHSLGGLIIRAALPYLEDYKNKFHTFLTLSTPHLGLMKPSKLIDAGIWVL